MNIGTVSENKNLEKRVAITPETVKKYNDLGFKVIVEKDYASHLGISDEQYKSCGAQIEKDKKNIIDKSDLILQLNLPSDENLSIINKNKILIGIFNYYENKDKLIQLSKKKSKYFFSRVITENYESPVYGCALISS